jgi:hypothetical protein
MNSPTAAAILLAARSAHAAVRWATKGFPLVDATTLQARLEACSTCSHWDPAARIGPFQGRCRHLKCGCTSLKHRLATETCPATPPKWPSLAPLLPPSHPPRTPPSSPS